ncbi:hypothetical protein [Algoriphagus vanfongensis]|uniref:hypothetical protein n=1 Tax=Algoriphagus vanfongensis TaxID=426371 RepID=UPI0004247DEB|nr:hypothetical protein [Algoriphagus vanfongensis]
MAKLRFKFEGFFEVETNEEIVLKPGDRFKVSGVIDGQRENLDSGIVRDLELQKTNNEEKEAVAATIAIGSDGEKNKKIVDAPFQSRFMTLEQFGGEGYYKLISDGLRFDGDVIESNKDVFTSQDVGKSFCGLYAHQNPLQPDKDNYYPGIVGSRYALVTEYISPRQIKVNFRFNQTSGSAYIFHDNSLAYQSAVEAAKRSPHRTLELQSEKTYVIPQFSKVELTHDFFMISQTGANLKIGWEDYFSWSEQQTIKQAGFLFDFGGNSVKIGFVNVNFIPPHRRVKSAQLFYSSLFRSTPNRDQEAKIGVVNMDTTVEVDAADKNANQIGFGYGFLYSSVPGNYVIGKNIKHRGPGFMDFKANFGGGLYAVFENIQTNFKREEEFASPRVQVRGHLKDNIFTITSGHTIYQIYSYDFGEGNVCHILHLGRFTFVIDGKTAVINACQFRVRPFVDGKAKLLVKDESSVYSKDVEIHAGDTLTFGGVTSKVIEKNRTYVTEWMDGGPDRQYAMCLKLDKPLPVSSGFHEFEVRSIGESLNNGEEVDAFLIYKANYDFRTYPDSKFGDGEVLSSDPVGHLSYNHREITLWAKKFKHEGFYRQSLSGNGESHGYTMIECEGFGGQFGPNTSVNHTGDMPAKASEFIAELESMTK